MAKLTNNLREIFNETLKGGISITGNTCAVIGDFNNTVKEFVKPDGSYTANWNEIGSTAYLDIPKNSTIKFAVLEWHSTISNYITKIDLNEAYTPIIFTTPKGTFNISVDSESDNEAIYYDEIFTKQSVKWDDVTSLISDGGDGYYTVKGIPTAPIVSDLNNLPNHEEAPAWSLIVVYENINLPLRNLLVYIGIQNHEYSIKKSDRVVNIKGLNVPSIPKKSYLSVVASNGDPNMYAGLNIYDNVESLKYSNDFKYLVGDYNDASYEYGISYILPYDNVFSGFIMNTNTESIDYGNIETRGTLASLNNTAFDILNQKSFRGNRGKLDILSFDISDKLKAFQDEVILTVDTTRTPSASPKIISYAFQIDIE